MSKGRSNSAGIAAPRSRERRWRRRADGDGSPVKLSLRLIVLMSLPPLLWAGNAVVGRLAVGNVPSQALNTLRWSLAGLLLLPLGWRVLASAAARARIWSRWRYLMLLAMVGVASYNALQYLALTTTTATNATLIAASGPVWMLLIGRLRYGVHARALQWAGSLLSLFGVLIVVARGDMRTLTQVQLVPGDLLMMLAVFVWSIYSWMLARPPESMQGARRPDWNWAEFLLLQVLFGVGWTWLTAGVEQAIAPQAIQWSPWVVLLVVYVAVGPSIIAYRAWGIGVAEAGPTLAAFFANLAPLFAAGLSAALLGEPPHLYHGLAFVLVLAGIAVSSR